MSNSKESRERSSMHYPRILFLLSLIIMDPTGIFAAIQSNTPQAGPPLIDTNPLLSYLLIAIIILGGIFFFVGYFWLLICTRLRGQSGWFVALIFISGIAIPLYLILDPDGD